MWCPYCNTSVGQSRLFFYSLAVHMIVEICNMNFLFSSNEKHCFVYPIRWGRYHERSFYLRELRATNKLYHNFSFSIRAWHSSTRTVTTVFELLYKN